MSIIRKMVILGDSISTPFIGDGGYEIQLRQLLAPREFHNLAVAQSGASTVTPDSVVKMLTLYAYVCEGADVVILWHGTNDWYWGAQIGSCGQQDDTTYIGALEIAIKNIRRYAPDSLLVMATPLYRREMPDGGQEAGDAWITTNKVGLTLADYERALRETAQAYAVPLVEMRALTGFCEQNSGRFLPDGVHPEKEGCDIIARIFAEHVEYFMRYRMLTKES